MIERAKERKDELKIALKEINAALKEPKYTSAATFVLGAIALLILLSGSGS